MVVDGDLHAGDVLIPAAEIHESASLSGGPGGQHVQRTRTRVTLRWSVRDSAALTEAQRARLTERLRLTREGELVVHAGTRRSQLANRKAARARLAELVAEALQVQRPRRRTRPSRAVARRRLEAKRRRSTLKAHRGKVIGED